MNGGCIVKKSLSFILSLIFLVSCGKGSSGGSALESTQAPVKQEEPTTDDTVYTNSLAYKLTRTISLESDLSNIEKFKKNINSYRLQATALTGHFTEGLLICEKIIFDQRKNTQRTWFDNRGESASVILEISPEDPSEITFECYVSVNKKQEESTQIKILKSYLISGSSTFISSGIGDAKKIGTLLLDENSSLAFEGRDVSLEVSELVSLGGVITTYTDENLKTIKQNVNGEHGGNLNIKIKEAKGELSFVMKGRDGGVVTNKREQKFPPADDASLNGSCRTDHYYHPSTVACFGKNGINGFDGEPGYSGFAGGNSGVLNLTIIKKEDLKLKITFAPGKGSVATPDTLPTRGQPGGTGSRLRWYERDDCHSNSAGAGGARGAMGGEMAEAVAKNNMNDQSYMTGRGFGTVYIQGCGYYSTYNFPNGQNGRPGKAVPEELKAKNGEEGKIETAAVEFVNEGNKFEINQEWKNY